LHTHAPPVVYRDLKPENVMVDPQDRVWLVDFGTARHFTRTKGTRIGSPGYAAPEQYSGHVDPRSDLYALGAVLHRVLSGRNPQEEAPFTFPPIATTCPGLDSRLEELVDKSLSFDMNNRPQSSQVVLSILRDIGGSRMQNPSANPRTQQKKAKVRFCTSCGTLLSGRGACPNCGATRYKS